MELRVGVKALIRNQAGEYLFIRRNPTKYPDLAEYWDIPGGRINPEESCKEGLRREVQEELGMRVVSISSPVAVQDIFVRNNGPHIVRVTYDVHAEGQPQLSDEHEEYAWLDRDAAVLGSITLDPYVHEVLEAKDE